MGHQSPGASWRAVGLLAAVLFLASILPSPLGRRPEFRHVGPDKLLHLVGHAGFAAAIAGAVGRGRVDDRAAGVIAVCLSTGYGLVLGRFQERVPGRVHEFADVVAGLVGSVLGVIGWSRVSGSAPATGRR